ncbi:MAG: leucine-rich repeat domain-containing protein [Candidatus Helarchaeota archaeon]
MYGISKEEALALKDLKKLLGESIPEVNKVDLYTFGMVIKDGKIVELSLFNKGLTAFPDRLINELPLILSIHNIQLKNLENSFGNLINLNKLYLYKNQLMTLPKPILKLKNLQSLSLGGNQLTTIPDSFGNLESLKELDLSANKFITLPDCIGYL